MSRTARLKIGYLVGLLVAIAVAILLTWWLEGDATIMVIVALALLIPGRVQGYFYRDLFRGRRLIALGQPEASIPYTTRFLEEIRCNPALKRLLWLQWSVYTTDAQAMALNNLGAAELELGHFEEAVERFRAALVIDPLYPLPYFNLALERFIASDRSQAERLAAEARRLGFHSNSVDQLIRQAQALLARLEGRSIRTSSRG